MRLRLLLGLSLLVAPSMAISACVGDTPVVPPPGSDAGGQDSTPAQDSAPSGDGACEAGFTTCGGGGTCATKLADDPLNCGACDHSCGGGACFAGACQAVAIASGLDSPAASEIAIDDTFVYFPAALENGVTTASVYKVPKAGGADASSSAVTLFVGPASQQVRGITVRNTDVLWTTNGISAGSGKVQFVPRIGGATQDIAVGENAPFGLAADANDVYWVATGAPAAVRKKALPAGAATTIIPSLANPTHIATNGTNLYYVEKGAVTMATVAGASPTIVAGTSGDIIGNIFVTPTAIFWSNYYTTHEILTASLSGTNPKSLYTGPSAAMYVTADAQNAYAVFQGTLPAQFKDGVLVKIPLNGVDKPVTIATFSRPQAVAIDASSIYVTGSSFNVAKSGTVWRLAK